MSWLSSCVFFSAQHNLKNQIRRIKKYITFYDGIVTDIKLIEDLPETKDSRTVSFHIENLKKSKKCIQIIHFDERNEKDKVLTPDIFV